MSINWSAWTPWSGLIGGALIGGAVAMLLLLNGRIAGISGVLGGLLRPIPGELAWRLAMVLGMVMSPLVHGLLTAWPAPRIEAGHLAVIAAGLLVGVGTRYGSGCTSGHGICGLSRLSPRSLVATLCFMGTGFLVVFVLRHGVGI